MRKIIITLSTVMALVFMVASAWTAEYEYAGPPAFTLEYPDDAQPEKIVSPDQVWAVKTPDGLAMQAGVLPLIEGSELKDYADKYYKPALAKSENTTVKLTKNEPYELSDGTKAYYAELEWKYQGSITITTVLITAVKDGKLVYVTGHPWQDIEDVSEMVKTLRFK
jgi:hypothetical protein